jgi:hypothetical protein
MTNKDGRAVARDNDFRVLRALHRFGWLRTRDLAALVWQPWSREAPSAPSLKPSNPPLSAIRMAQRTLCRLRGRRLVLHGRAPNGSTLYALSEAGARHLQQAGIAATTGKDLVRHFSVSHFKHRCIANEIAIGAIVEGCRVATEREVSQGLWIGGQEGIAGKKPDVLMRCAGAVWWIEVERSRRNAHDYSRLLWWLHDAGKDAQGPAVSALLGNELRWGRIVFVCAPAFREKLCRDLEAAGWTRSRIDALIFFSTSLYVLQDISFL